MGLTKKRMILVELEGSNYGKSDESFSNPAGTVSDLTYTTPPSTAVKCGSLNITPLAGEVVQRNIVQQHFGNTENIQVTQYATVDFEVEIAGGGINPSATVGDINVPQYDALLKACGFKTTTTPTDTESGATGSIVYQLFTPETLTDTNSSIKIWFFNDDILHRLVGARGNVSFDLSVKKIPTMKFTFTGLLEKTDPYSDRKVSFPNIAYKDIVPIPVSTNNTVLKFFNFTTGEISGVYTKKMPLTEMLTVDMANDVKLRTLIGGEHVVISDRKPKGQIKFEVPTLATKNFFDLARQKTAYGSERGLEIEHGKDAGNKFKISAPKIAIDAPKYGTNEGYDMLDMGLVFLPANGNDELTITIS